MNYLRLLKLEVQAAVMVLLMHGARTIFASKYEFNMKMFVSD